MEMHDTPLELHQIAGVRCGAASMSEAEIALPDVCVVFAPGDAAHGTACIRRTGSYSAPAIVSSPRAAAGRLRVLVANSGVANSFTGDEGVADARATLALASEKLQVPNEQAMVASTGSQGVRLPMDAYLRAVEQACERALDPGDGDVAAVLAGSGGSRRVASCSGLIGETEFRIAGASRGVKRAYQGAPASVAVFATDLAISADCMDRIFVSAVQATFARIAPDPAIESEDCICIFSSGQAGEEPVDDFYAARPFAEALEAVMARLAFDLALAGEEGTKLIECRARSARDDREAGLVARALCGSSSLRMALHRGEPCWPLAIAACECSGAGIARSRARVAFGGIEVAVGGREVGSPDLASLAAHLKSDRIVVEVELGMGESEASAWTTDLSDGERKALSAMSRELEEAVAARKTAEANLVQTEFELASVRRELKSARVSLEISENSMADAKESVARIAEANAKAEELEAEKAKLQKEMKRLQVQLEIAERKAGSK